MKSFRRRQYIRLLYRAFRKRAASFPEFRQAHRNFGNLFRLWKSISLSDSNTSNIGAVNVIKFIKEKNGDLKLKGYNSDIIGFCDSIKPLIKPQHTHALILGTGGAAKAVVVGLKSMGIETLYVSRTKTEQTITYEDLNSEIIDKYKIIINATPLGMYPNIDSCPNIPYESLTDLHLCYDLLYNPDITLFMKKAKASGAVVKNGLEMLLLQAFAAWEIWQQ